jgi:hypothetical protein
MRQRWCLTMMVAALIGGCATKSYNPPPSLGSVDRPISHAQEKIQRVLENGKEVYSYGTSAKSKIASAIVTDSTGALSDLQAARHELTVKANEVEELQIQAEKWHQKYKESDKALWKRNRIIAGLAVASGGLLFWIFKGPILGAIGFIARKLGGVPW